MIIKISERTLGIASGILALASVIATTVYTIHEYRKTVRLQEQFDNAINDLEDTLRALDSSIEDIKDSVDDKIDISEAAVSEALDRAMKEAAEAQSRMAIREVYDDMKSQVSTMLQSMIDKLEPQARSEISRVYQRKVNNLSVAQVRREAKESCEAYMKTEYDRIIAAHADKLNGEVEVLKKLEAKLLA